MARSCKSAYRSAALGDFALIDLKTLKLASRCYDYEPFGLAPQPAMEAFSSIAAIDLIENGPRAEREFWQKRQVVNLLRHAQSKSSFWRKRIGKRNLSFVKLTDLPIQSRADVAEQTKAEGSLDPDKAGRGETGYASTGSTGTPVKVFVSKENGRYNALRSLADYFMRGLPLDDNRTVLGPGIHVGKIEAGVAITRRRESWSGPLAGLFQTGPVKSISHNYDDAGLVAELLKDRVGYLNCPSRLLEIVIKREGEEILDRLGIRLWRHTSDYCNPDVVEALRRRGIPTVSAYSCGEMGAIAFECAQTPRHFHVATSNVIVESDESLTASYDGVTVSRLLATHLHSYATPLIRYDLGDFGRLHERCPCGHDGPTLSDIYGRAKSFVKLADGGLTAFYISTRALLAVTPFNECRFTQVALDRMVCELSGRDPLGAEEEKALKHFLQKAIHPSLEYDIRTTPQIDWSDNPKRLIFTCRV